MVKKDLKFIQCEKDNQTHIDTLLKMMIPYFHEVYTQCENAGKIEVPPDDHITKISKSMIQVQNGNDRHLEICCESEDTPIGFYHAKIGHNNKDEHIGFILEFYILPDYRHRGYGKALFQRIETLFLGHGIKKIRLRSYSFTGMPFWESLGFENVDIKERFYEKALI